MRMLCMSFRGIIKGGKVVVLLNGRYAGRKAVVVKSYEDGTSDRKFSHAIGNAINQHIINITSSCHAHTASY